MSTATPRVITRALATAAVAFATGGALVGAATPSGAAPGAPASYQVAVQDDHRAPVVGRSAPGAIDGRYIVVLNRQSSRTVAADARKVAVDKGGRITYQYGTALKGFAAKLPNRAVRALRANPAVAYIEADRRVSIDGDQTGATWGLDRVDQRNLPLNSTYHYDATGSGVKAYIIDTGVLTTHNEFTGRTAPGYSAIGGTPTDCHGHGTHVAGTVGGTTYGVAKGATIIPVRVLDCNGSGTDSGVIAGIDWVTSNHTSGPAVANMSLGGGVSSSLDAAVNNSINDGVFYAVAAGNDNGANACNGSPGRVPAAVTVGSTTSSDARSSFSNIGSCLDIFAPGSSITSAWYTSNTATNTISGTSMATPHVTGAAALYLQTHATASPSAVSSWLTSNATTGKVTNPGTGSPNRLLYTLEGTTEPPPSGNLLVNPGFESGNTGWSSTSGVITSSTSRPARTGSWKAWLNGYGSSNTDTLSQSVTLPSSGTKTLAFYIRIDSAETTTSTAYDTLKVQVVAGGTTTTLATYSNLNKNSSYVLKSFSLAGYAGQTVTVKFTGTEDYSLQTSFVIDDTSVS